MKETTPLFICDRNEHLVHLAFAEAIGADYYYYNLPNYIHNPLVNLESGFHRIYEGIKLPKYNTYLSINLLTPVIKNIIQKNKSKIIHFTASSYYPSLTSGIPIKVPFYEKAVIKHLFKSIDGIITVSEFMKEEISKISNCPIKVVSPFIDPIRYDKLLSLKPNLDNHTIVFIGSGNRKRAINDAILIDAFREIKNEFEDSKLYILGKNYSKKLELHDGIYVTGYTKNINEFLEKSSLSVLPGYGTSFHVSVIETICAGLPTIVSKYTGAKDVVERVNTNFIRDITPEDFTKGIKWYFNLSLDKKIEYSEKGKKVSTEYTKEKKCNDFREKFNLLINTE